MMATYQHNDYTI